MHGRSTRTAAGEAAAALLALVALLLLLLPAAAACSAAATIIHPQESAPESTVCTFVVEVVSRMLEATLN